MVKLKVSTMYHCSFLHKMIQFRVIFTSTEQKSIFNLNHPTSLWLLYWLWDILSLKSSFQAELPPNKLWNLLQPSAWTEPSRASLSRTFLHIFLITVTPAAFNPLKIILPLTGTNYKLIVSSLNDFLFFPMGLQFLNIPVIYQEIIQTCWKFLTAIMTKKTLNIKQTWESTV